MARPTFSDVLLLQHLASSCAKFMKQYITQSRATQRAGVQKGYGEVIPESTFDRSIRKDKDREWMWKQHRSGNLNGNGYSWKTSLTYLTFKGLMYLWKHHLITREVFETLKRIFGLVKNGKPEDANGPPAIPRTANRGMAIPFFAVPP